MEVLFNDKEGIGGPVIAGNYPMLNNYTTNDRDKLYKQISAERK